MWIQAIFLSPLSSCCLMWTLNSSQNTPFLYFTHFCFCWLHSYHFFSLETPSSWLMHVFLLVQVELCSMFSTRSFTTIIVISVFPFLNSYSNLSYHPFGSWDFHYLFTNACALTTPTTWIYTDKPHFPCLHLASQFLEGRNDIMFVFSTCSRLSAFFVPSTCVGEKAQEGINISLDKMGCSVCGGQGPQGGSKGLGV